MLVVTRKKDEKLMIGDDIEVQILRIGRENVRLGIKAPAEVSIYRHEIYEAIQRREQAAAASPPEGPAEEPATARTAAASAETPPPADTESSPTESPKARAKAEG